MMLIQGPASHKSSEEGQVRKQVIAVTSSAAACFTRCSVHIASSSSSVVMREAEQPHLAESEHPELARIWKNESDAIFDTL
jgi:hypothetical protein